MDDLWQMIKDMVANIWQETKKFFRRTWDRIVHWFEEFVEGAITLVRKTLQLGADIVCECVLFGKAVKDTVIEITNYVIYERHTGIEGVIVGNPISISPNQLPAEILEKFQKGKCVGRKDLELTMGN